MCILKCHHGLQPPLSEKMPRHLTSQLAKPMVSSLAFSVSAIWSTPCWANCVTSWLKVKAPCHLLFLLNWTDVLDGTCWSTESYFLRGADAWPNFWNGQWPQGEVVLSWTLSNTNIIMTFNLFKAASCILIMWPHTNLKIWVQKTLSWMNIVWTLFAPIVSCCSGY